MIKIGKLLSIFLLLSLIACSASSLTSETIEDKVTKDINTAINNNDYRLYSMGGRVLSFPGIDNSELNSLISECGQKIMEDTTDVLKQEDDFKRLELAFKYAKKYNEKMKLHCKRNK